MRLKVLPHHLTVAKYERVPAPIRGFYSLSVTESEVSLVAETAFLPEGALIREDGWRAFMVEGQLDFSLVGVLSGITSALAERGVPLFALSTYDTDCVLVKEGDFNAACEALKLKGYIIL